jgi:tetratricopeptide (TPR) repeat protein
MEMSRKLSFIPDDDSNEIVKRYEAFLSRNNVSGYFDVEELESIVDYYLRKGRTRESSKALEFGFRLHPNSTELMTKRAKIYLAVGETNKAFRILESQGVTDDYEVNLLKIDALTRLDRNKEAHILCDKMIASETTDQDNVCLDIAYIFLGQFDPDSAFKYLKVGETYNPKNVDLLFELAFCYEQRQDNDQAINSYHKIIRFDPYAAEAWFNLGQIHFSQQEFQEALNAYGYAQTIRPEDSLTYLQKGHTHFQLQQYEEALEEFFSYEKMVTENWQTYLFIGECYERREMFTLAIEYYQKSLSENEENFEALTGIGICLLEQELFNESMVYIRRAIALNDSAADAWVYLAEALTGIDDTRGALLAYLKSIELDPAQPDTLMAIANICMEQGEFTLALQYYIEAERLDRDHELENINLFMAVAYFKVGATEASEVALKKAVAENLDALNLFHELCPEANQ